MGKTDGSSTNGALHTHVSPTSDSAATGTAPDEPSIAEPPLEVVAIEKPLSAHTLPAERVAALLDSNLQDGLSNQDAAARLARDGPNTIKGAKGLSLWEIFLQQVANALTVVLIAVTALSFAIQDYIEGGVVAAVIVLNIVVGYVSQCADPSVAFVLCLSSSFQLGVLPSFSFVTYVDVLGSLMSCLHVDSSRIIALSKPSSPFMHCPRPSAKSSAMESLKRSRLKLW